MDYQQLLVDHLDQVDRLVRLAGRRHRLTACDADEFAGVVRFQLVDRDFAILRKFQGRSSLTTYLAVVIERLCLDFCIARWGKWRPSASARRLGAVATLLEQLIVREGITFDEAVGTLQTNHRVAETREQLHDMLLQLRPRITRRLAHDSVQAFDQESLTHRTAHHPDDRLIVERVQAALAAALAVLPAADREILVLHYEVGMPIAQVARALNREAHLLYRHFTRITERLRVEMEVRGVESAEIAHVITHLSLSLGDVLVEFVQPPGSAP